MSLLDDQFANITVGAGEPSEAVRPSLANESLLGQPRWAPSAGWCWMLVLSAALLAGLAGFSMGEIAPKFFPVSIVYPPEIRGPEKAIEYERRLGVSRDNSAALAYGWLGMILGLTLGVAGGVSRRSPGAAVAAGIVGMVLGGGAGLGMTVFLLPIYHATPALCPTGCGRQ